MISTPLCPCSSRSRNSQCNFCSSFYLSVFHTLASSTSFSLLFLSPVMISPVAESQRFFKPCLYHCVTPFFGGGAIFFPFPLPFLLVALTITIRRDVIPAPAPFPRDPQWTLAPSSRFFSDEGCSTSPFRVVRFQPRFFCFPTNLVGSKRALPLTNLNQYTAFFFSSPESFYLSPSAQDVSENCRQIFARRSSFPPSFSRLQ